MTAAPAPSLLAATAAGGHGDASTLFDLLPVGAYRSTPQGTMLRANAALVRFNGYANERELLAACRDVATEAYVDPQQRARFVERLERDGQVTGFVSEMLRHRTRERVWVSENAHIVRDGAGQVLYYEGTIEEITDRVRAQAALQRSEAHLRLITEHLPGVVYRVRTTPSGRRMFEFVSEGVRSLFGLEPQQLMADGSLIEAFRHPDDRERIAEAIASSVRSAKPLTIEFRIVVPGDGAPGNDAARTKWLQVTSAPVISDEAGSVRIGVMIDITQSKQAEVALRESEQRWKLALEATGDGVWDWDIESGGEVYSRRFCEMYGFEPEEIEHRLDFFDERTHPDDVPQMQRDRQAHFDRLTPTYVNEHRIRCKDGSWKWVLTRGLVIRRDAQGRPARMIGTHTDITAQKQAAALRAERDRAESADRAKTQLLSRVSHELRTPLNAVLGFGQLLESDPSLAERHRAWTQQILASGQHLLGLVDDVLDLSSAHAGQLNLSLGAVELRQAVADCWTMLIVAPATPRPAGLRYVDEGAGGAPLWVHADGRRLKQVLSNLLSNAVKYNRPGGEVRVRSAATADGAVELQVADTGSGMSAEQLARLFNPFERLGAQHTGVQGSGLGLALSKQLVEAMGGRIEVHSAPGQGTRFTVRLDAAPMPAY
ncbi:PAS domain-containing protein [Aquincola sp. S2]|uniref:histidine kinase n=1 Tax=Pseudaquabacterium terrae TaxID=2732868 RepID=A0ABX2EL50_9BURK|nr:PAS domain-containing sensor histidine kinase [Aquabacterium terrae]NRF69295.1 PAS domain-containing protein [Aquabacterium terrae]